MKSQTIVGAGAKTVSRGASFTPASGESMSLGIEMSAIFSRIPARLLLWSAVLVLIIVMVSQRSLLLSMVDHEIEAITVQGDLKELNVESIESTLQAYLGSSFLMADLQQVKNSVEALPWVYQSTVSRVWPAEIRIVVEEQSPVAYWNAGALLNARGDVFKPADLVVNDDMPKLSGPASSEQHVRLEMLATMARLQTQLSTYGLSASGLNLKSRGVWEVSLTNGILIALGKSPFESKIERLGAVLARTPAGELGRIKEIDARYPNGVAVKWKEIVVAAENGS